MFLAKVFGIPIKLHVSWFLVAALIIWSLASTYFPREYPSDFKKIGFDNPSVRNLVKIIELIQSRPPLIVNQAGRFITVRLEGDHRD